MFYIKQESDKMCKTELNKTRAAQLWEDSRERKKKISCPDDYSVNTLLSIFQAK